MNKHKIYRGFKHCFFFSGWHNRLHQTAGAGPSFYVLVTLLHRESEQITEYVRLVNEAKLSRRQRQKTRAAEARILPFGTGNLLYLLRYYLTDSHSFQLYFSHMSILLIHMTLGHVLEHGL